MSLRSDLQKSMMDNCGVYRTEGTLKKALSDVAACRQRFSKIHVSDKSQVFNTDLLDAMELNNLIDLARVTVEAALARQESRGAHYREDYKKRDDAHWLKHSLASLSNGKVDLKYKPVVMGKFQPQERKY